MIQRQVLAQRRDMISGLIWQVIIAALYSSVVKFFNYLGANSNWTYNREIYHLAGPYILM
ncbi:hypothetical protein BDV37DRAFT_243618 [Aspergillus pseudonomiae]|uniref:Uncharacterized protein n=1 Tax=Aspergillus pseudonomiae TaxID=1506151 RepID=A0A5N7DI91_9EURO|nr:uncharacterized protein BDV37DRAFT_243618 [Aspergillus pseudonomiae]KAE8405965.1 hypothetical protein BDV37DRAFT_243618 [Aspergillus pseudonomiae]